MGLFESHVPLQSITIMVQKEVADRMQVGPGTKDYGALSLAVQYYAKPEIVANVPPNCFIPRPNVGSAVIRLDRYAEPPVQTADEQFMFSVIRASFNQRRKTLVNGLSNAPGLNVSKEKIKEVLARMELSETVRGETLTLEQFAKKLFGEDTKVKFRPHHFPFTEPSAEMDVTCFKCGGKGCRMCKGEGWIEILGCGMIHPHVFEMSGIDQNKYTGFAFGIGLERIALLKYEIDDMRLLYENDVRFLKQF